MEVRQFAEMLAEELAKIFEEAKVSVREVKKNNDVTLTGITLEPEGCNVAQTLYVEGLYQDYCQGQSLEETVEIVATAFRDSIPEKKMDLSFYSRWEVIKDKVCFTLQSKNRNPENLKGMPHRNVLDVVMTYYVPIEDEEIGKGTIAVLNSHIESWGVTEADLYEAARRNTPVLVPGRIMPMEKVLMRVMGRDFSEEDCDLQCGEHPMLVVSNRDCIKGAAAILYEGVADKIAKAFGGDFFIIPSSIHECLVLPATEVSGDDLRYMVCDVNRTQVPPMDVLSDSVYFYDAGKRTISVYGGDAKASLEVGVA